MVTNSGGQTLVFVVLAGCDMLGMVGWSVRVIPIAPPHPRPHHISEFTALDAHFSD
jgi:hypothetical protein